MINTITTPFISSPGELIKEEIEYRNISQRQLSKLTGLATIIINEVLKAKRNCTP